MTFDPTKPVQTRDGCPARVLCTDRRTSSEYPIIALYNAVNGDEVIESYTPEGFVGYRQHPCSCDLVNVPEKRTVFINVFSCGVSAYSSRAAADRASTSYRICCVETEIEIPS